VAIYHLSAQIISRKAGRSATAAAAYRACEKIVDERTGEIHDYARKRGMESADIVMPSGSTWQPDRAELWNAVEAKNKRADAQVAREFCFALPDELDAGQRRQLAVDFAQELADRYCIAADVAIHAPDRSGDERNHHAHVLTTTNRIDGAGLGNKARELDLVAHNMGGGVGKANEIDRIRKRWATMVNDRLRQYGHAERIDHRSHADRGIEAEPGQHLGPTATAIERRGQRSQRGQEIEGQQAERAALRAEQTRAGAEVARVERDLAQARADRAEIERRRIEAERIAELDRQAIAEAAEYERQAAARAEADRQAREQIKAEQERRIAALPAIRKNRAGAAYIMADMALEALQGGRVGDWQEIEKAAVIRAIRESGQNRAEIVSDVIEVSPGFADPVRRQQAETKLAAVTRPEPTRAATPTRSPPRMPDKDGGIEYG